MKSSLKITKITGFQDDTKYFLLSPFPPFKRVIFPIPQEFREWLLKFNLKLPKKTPFKVLKKKKSVIETTLNWSNEYVSDLSRSPGFHFWSMT